MFKYYSPDLKRFMNRDVIVGTIEQSQTLNRYAYVNGNPISYHDPFGLARETLSNTVSTVGHTVLDGIGMIPVVGEIFDGVNAIWYLSEGDYLNAGLSGMAIIPVVGNAATGAKYGLKAAKYADDVVDGVKLVSKYGDDVAEIGGKVYNKHIPLVKPTSGDSIGSMLRSRLSYGPDYKHFTPYEYSGSVKVSGVKRDVSRRVYQRHDTNFNLETIDGRANLKRMRAGQPPVGSDGNAIELHHLAQKETDTMAEVLSTKHSENYDMLHSSHGDSYVSWRNDPVLDKQYNNFRRAYWIDRYRNLQ